MDMDTILQSLTKTTSFLPPGVSVHRKRSDVNGNEDDIRLETETRRKKRRLNNTLEEDVEDLIDTSDFDFETVEIDEETAPPVKSISDEEERQENETLMKLMTMPYTKTKQSRDVDDFQAEMEAERDKRALDVESLGGVQHQKSLSRSSSTSSLQKMSQSPQPSPSQQRKNHTGDSASKQKKSVRFAPPTLESTEPKSQTRSSEPPPPGETESFPGSSSGTEKKEFYDSIYFDSDESEGEDDASKNAKQKKRAFVSDDDLLYDPESDARDQAWIDNRRKKYSSVKEDENPGPSTSTSGKSTKAKKSTGLPNSDAVLNCPACFTTLCLDCQRHELYTNQYRAMFVMNCVIDKSETLRVPVKVEKKGRKNRGRVDNQEEELTNPSSDLFNPVKCKICTTQVAVYDSEEVYHFFNVLSSYA